MGSAASAGSAPFPSEETVDGALRVRVSEYEKEIVQLKEKGKSEEAELKREKLELFVRQEYRAGPARWAGLPAWADKKAREDEEQLRWGSKAWFFDGEAKPAAAATADEKEATEGVADEGVADEKEEVHAHGDDEGDRKSIRAVRTFGSVFLEGAVRRGLATGVNALELEKGGVSTGGTKFEDGHVVKYGSRTFGKVVHFLGSGAMGYVYKFDYVPAGGGGTVIQCALKLVRSTANVKKESELEKALASEIAIAFACGRAVGIASVLDALIPELGVSEGRLMLICDLVDGGDLEEGMHSGAKRYGRLVEDYDGVLYTDAGMKVWPLISIMLQIFLAFDHIHSRGIIHQARYPAPLCFTSGELPDVVRCERSRAVGQYRYRRTRQNKKALRSITKCPVCVPLVQQQDFKPANLMLRKDGVVKIADFGEFAKFVCCGQR
jgi:hypothetical protein